MDELLRMRQRIRFEPLYHIPFHGIIGKEFMQLTEKLLTDLAKPIKINSY